MNSTSIAAYVAALENENSELRRRLDVKVVPPPPKVSLLADPERLLFTPDVLEVLPIPKTALEQYIKPRRIGKSKRWRAGDVRDVIKILGGKGEGFYTTGNVKTIFGYMSDSAPHRAAKEGRIPPKLKINNTALWVKEDIDAAAKGEWKP